MSRYYTWEVILLTIVSTNATLAEDSSITDNRSTPMGSTSLHLVTKEPFAVEENKSTDIHHYIPFDRSPSKIWPCQVGSSAVAKKPRSLPINFYAPSPIMPIYCALEVFWGWLGTSHLWPLSLQIWWSKTVLVRISTKFITSRSK